MQMKSKLLINRYSLDAGFTLMEVVLASALSIVVVILAGMGLLTIMTSDIRNNADGELIDNVNRASTFMSEEVKQGQSVVTEANISSTNIPSTATKVLGIVNPKFSTQQIVYYTDTPRSQDRLIGPRVLYRYGPNLATDGTYDNPTNTANWGISPIVDMIPLSTDTSVQKTCQTGWTKIPANNTNTDGFFVCINGTNRVNLKITAKVALSTGTNDKSLYSLDTNVFTRSKAP